MVCFVFIERVVLINAAHLRSPRTQPRMNRLNSALHITLIRISCYCEGRRRHKHLSLLLLHRIFRNQSQYFAQFHRASIQQIGIMGKGFGNLYYIRNIVYYKVSSYEQKAFANFWKDSFTNIFNEVKFNAPYILPPATIAYLTLKWGETERERMIRKDPKLYEDE